MLQAAFPSGASRIEPPELSARGSRIGRRIHQRFVIESDLSDPGLGDEYSILLVKDLQNHGREALLKISRSVLSDAGPEGPSLKDVSDVLAQLGHPNIEEVLETGWLADGRPFALTRPYPASGTLAQLMTPGKGLELDVVVPLVAGIAGALATAHSKGILHCDLRPGNILVPTGGIGPHNVTVINFGLGWPIDVRGEGLANVPPGSEALRYAAPELFVALGHRSRASDIYSMAVLVYRLLLGRVPYHGRDRAGMLALINSESATPPTDGRTDVSGEAANVILSALRFEPRLRPQDMEDFGQRLVRVLRPRKGISVRRATGPPVGLAVSSVPRLPQVSAAGPVGVFDEGTSPRSPMRKTAALRANPHETGAPVSDRAVAWALIILLMAGALSIPIGQTLLRKKGAEATVDTMAGRPARTTVRHQIKYWFEPRKQDVEKTGLSGSPLALVSDTGGETYVFTEFVGGDGRPTYRLMFRSATAAEVGHGFETGKPVKIAKEFPGDEPSKALWIVWTASRSSELESVCDSATGGLVSNDDDRRRLRHFLERNRDVRLESSTDRATGQTTLETMADRSVHRIQLGENK